MSEFGNTNNLTFLKLHIFMFHLLRLQVAKEIIIGLFKGRNSKSYGNDNDNNNNNPNNLDLACEYKDRMTSCGSTENTLRRIINMMRNSGRFRFQN